MRGNDRQPRRRASDWPSVVFHVVQVRWKLICRTFAFFLIFRAAFNVGDTCFIVLWCFYGYIEAVSFFFKSYTQKTSRKRILGLYRIHKKFTCWQLCHSFIIISFFFSFRHIRFLYWWVFKSYKQLNCLVLGDNFNHLRRTVLFYTRSYFIIHTDVYLIYYLLYIKRKKYKKSNCGVSNRLFSAESTSRITGTN